MNNYRELIAWQVAYDLTKKIFSATEAFQSSEQFGLSQQMRRAAVSIPSNIAEGFYRGSKREYYRFCRIAYSSAAELETQIMISKDLQFIKKDQIGEIESLIERLMKLLNRLTYSLKQS